MEIIVAILLGVIAALALDIYIPAALSSYVAIIILASLDSVFGAIRSNIEKKFNLALFISGLAGNSLLAAVLTFIGKKLDVDLYLAAVIVFGTRLFQNFAFLRRYYLHKFLKYKELKNQK